MKERFSPFKTIRNTTAAVALIPAGALFNVDNSEVDTYAPTQQNRVKIQDTSLLDQLDEFIETDYGKALAASVFALSLASAAYNLQAKYEIDDKKKYTLSLATSTLFFAVSASILYQTEGDLDPKITGSLIEAYALAQAAYNSIDAKQRHKEFRKRLPAYGSSAAMIAASTAILAETIK